MRGWRASGKELGLNGVEGMKDRWERELDEREMSEGRDGAGGEVQEEEDGGKRAPIHLCSFSFPVSFLPLPSTPIFTLPTPHSVLPPLLQISPQTISIHPPPSHADFSPPLPPLFRLVSLRSGLLPDDNFEDDGINPMAKPGAPVASQGSTSGSLKIKKIKRNYS